MSYVKSIIIYKSKQCRNIMLKTKFLSFGLVEARISLGNYSGKDYPSSISAQHQLG